MVLRPELRLGLKLMLLLGCLSCGAKESVAPKLTEPADPESEPTTAIEAAPDLEGAMQREDSRDIGDRTADPLAYSFTSSPILNSQGEALAGLEIWTARPHALGTLSNYFYPGYFGPDRADFEMRYLLKVRTDQDGKARFPRGPRSYWVDGEKEGGLLYIPSCGNTSAAKSDLHLDPLTWRTVRVVDHVGFPVADARVGVWDSERTRGGSLLGVTDSTGKARLPITKDLGKTLYEDDGSLFVQTLRERIVSRHVLEDSSQDPVVLSLPDAPALELKILHPDGHLYEEAVVVSISHRSARTSMRIQGGATRGVFRIPSADPGAKIFLRVESWDEQYSFVEDLVLPNQETGTIALTVPLSQDRMILTGKLLDEQSRPMASTPMRITLGEWSSDDGTTNARGVFRMELDRDEHLDIETEIDIGVFYDKQLRSHGLISGVDFSPNEVDLGSITLFPPPLVAGGRVRNPDGSPASGLPVSLLRKDGTVWKPEMQSHTITGQYGEFTLRGPLPPKKDGPYFLSTGGVYHENISVSITPGVPDLDLTVRRLVHIQGQFLFPSTVLATSLRLEFQETDAPSSRPRPEADFTGNDGSFKVMKAPEGTYSATLFSADGRELHVEHAVRVDGYGGVLVMKPIDLSRDLRYFHLTCRDETGEGIHLAQYRVGNHDRWKSMPRGQAGIFLRGFEEEVSLRAKGFDDRTVLLKETNGVVVLERVD